MVGQGNLVKQMKNTSCLFPVEIVRCSTVPSTQNWQKPVGTMYTHLLSREVWLEVVFIKELQPKSYTFNMETRPSNSTMHEYESMMSKNFKYLAVAEGSLFVKGLESGTIMSVCTQQ